MKKNRLFYSQFSTVFLGIAFLVNLILSLSSCSPPAQNPINLPGYDTSHKQTWVDWNVLFKDESSVAQRNEYIKYLEHYIDSCVAVYNTHPGNNLVVHKNILHCPCDPLLYNFNVTPLGGSGQAANPPPPPAKGLGGSGNSVSYINLNNTFTIDSVTKDMASIDTTKQVHLLNSTIDSSKILAVMDTGLDSTLFQNHFRGLMWNDPKGKTIRNFQFFSNGRSLEDGSDDDAHKHGTAVTFLALQATEVRNEKQQIKPLVMVLKVLDSFRVGSTFTVSCALKYTILKHATLVNASLGYYSSRVVDSILRCYVDQCNRTTPNIPILAAAGNLKSPHPGPYCAPTHFGNELHDSRLFFPACFRTEFSNVISVTGLHTPKESCFYQNYSSKFVSVGVLTKMNSANPNCCVFNVPFLKDGYEGSSFATPVFSGIMMRYLLRTPGSVWTNGLHNISKTPISLSGIVTVGGRYVEN